MTNDDPRQPMLDGLVLKTPQSGSLREAVVATLDALKDDGLLEARHTAVAQLALVLADAVERGAISNKPYSAAQNAAQLIAALDQLPKPREAGLQEKWDEMLAKLLADDHEDATRS